MLAELCFDGGQADPRQDSADLLPAASAGLPPRSGDVHHDEAGARIAHHFGKARESFLKRQLGYIDGRYRREIRPDKSGGRDPFKP